MEQQGLSPRDLEPFIGSRSKVSEVLSGKVPLSLRMIRALSQGLEIPAEVMLASPKTSSPEGVPRLPVAEIVRQGWVDVEADNESVYRSLVAEAGGPKYVEAFARQSAHVRESANFDAGAQVAWQLRVLALARKDHNRRTYEREALSPEFMRDFVQLSAHSDGPRQAVGALAEVGIAVVGVAQLPRTRLDGAALLAEEGRPVIGLTLRFDRLDNFWFTIIHEVIHVREHLGVTAPAFFDDLDSSAMDEIEEEADALTREAIVPAAKWNRCRAARERSPAAVLDLAHELGIHPGIVAGLVRHDANNYRILGQLVGQGEVRRVFPEWSQRR
jgi:HTH-type transcriptional regulator/antitoxin HigA